MNAVAIGRAGLTGVKGKVAHRVSEPVARRTPLSRDQVEAIIGAVFLGVAWWQFWRTLRRVWKAREAETA